MATLDELRARIDSLDASLAKLLNARMDVSLGVAEYKTEHNLQIAHLDREDAIIKNFLSSFDAERAGYVSSVYQTMIRSSRAFQYHYQVAHGISSPMIDLLKGASDAAEPIETVCFQGVAGAWSNLAAKHLYPQAKTFAVPTFEDIFLAISEGRAQAGVLPLDNTTAGSVDDVYDLLIRYDCMIQTAEPFPIRHCLLGVPGSSMDTVKTVFSHPQGLAQCAGFIRENGYLPVAERNTAIAAEQIAKKGDLSCAAIASRETADLYGLTILRETINDSACNQTRFVSIAKKCVVPNGANRISLAFRLPNRSGALANVLGLFADHGINLLKISSRPIPNQPWEYSFYLNCAIDGLNNDLFGLLRQLDSELSWVKLLGCYTEQSFEEANEVTNQ